MRSTALLSALMAMVLVVAGCAGNRVAAVGDCDPCDAQTRIARATPTADPGGGAPPMEVGASAGEAWCRVWIPPVCLGRHGRSALSGAPLWPLPACRKCRGLLPRTKL